MEVLDSPRSLSRGLTTELSDPPRQPLRPGEHAMHCEHRAPATIHGRLQRVVRRHFVSAHHAQDIVEAELNHAVYRKTPILGRVEIFKPDHMA